MIFLSALRAVLRKPTLLVPWAGQPAPGRWGMVGTGGHGWQVEGRAAEARWGPGSDGMGGH